MHGCVSVGCDDGGRGEAFSGQDHGAAGVVEDPEGRPCVSGCACWWWWKGGQGGYDEIDELFGEEDVAAAGALAVGPCHVADEGGVWGGGVDCVGGGGGGGGLIEGLRVWMGEGFG